MAVSACKALYKVKCCFSTCRVMIQQPVNSGLKQAVCVCARAWIRRNRFLLSARPLFPLVPCCCECGDISENVNKRQYFPSHGDWLASTKSRSAVLTARQRRLQRQRGEASRLWDSRALQQNSTRQLYTVPWQQPCHWSPVRFQMTNGMASRGWCLLLGKHDAEER